MNYGQDARPRPGQLRSGWPRALRLPVEPSAACQLFIDAHGLFCPRDDQRPNTLWRHDAFFGSDVGIRVAGRIRAGPVDILAGAAEPGRCADRKQHLQRHACKRFLDAGDLHGFFDGQLRQPSIDQRLAELLSEPWLHDCHAEFLSEPRFERRDAQLDGWFTFVPEPQLDGRRTDVSSAFGRHGGAGFGIDQQPAANVRLVTGELRYAEHAVSNSSTVFESADHYSAERVASAV